jgi:hypothetical protein
MYHLQIINYCHIIKYCQISFPSGHLAPRKHAMSSSIRPYKLNKAKIKGLASSQIIYLNLREFGQMIIRDHLWDLPNRISG